jgi:iron complex outermembrane recepter protein
MAFTLRTQLRTIARLLSTSILMGTAFAPSYAQDTKASATTGGLDEIVVTARKRAESVQDVPLSISTFSAKSIERQNIMRVEDINRLAPNLTVENGAGVGSAASFVLRGIGSYDYELYADTPVALYVDGVYIARPQASNGEMFDLERIEVLYGPQGTLFGRNTTGGAIAMYTRGPADKFQFQQRAAYGTDNEIILRSVLDTGELGTSGWKAKLGYYRRQMDGWQEDLNTKKSTSPGSRTVNAFAGQLHGDVGDLKVDIRGDYRHTKYRPTAYELIGVTQDVIDYFSRSPQYGGNPFVYTTERNLLKKLYQNNAYPAAKDESWGTSLTLEYAMSPAFNIKNVLAYRKLKLFSNNDPGGQGFLFGEVLDNTTFLPAGIAPVTPLNAVTTSRQNQISNELQVTGNLGQFDYLLGLFYFREKSHGSQFVDATFVLAGGLFALNNNVGKTFNLKTTSTAAYGQISYRPAMFDNKVEITGGLRYTRDEKGFDQILFLNGGVTGTQALKKNFENVAGSLSINYKINSDVMIYGRYATGYKAGGFNPGTIQPPYNPEKAQAFEIGFKSDLFDNVVRLNAALFHTKYDDLQTTQFLFTGTEQLNVILNAAQATYTGGEAQLTIAPTSNFLINGYVGVIKPKYKKFIIEDPTTFQPIDISNTAHFQLLSKYNFGVGAEYTFGTVGIGELSARVDYAYKSKRFWYASDELNPRNHIIAGNAADILSASIMLDKIAIGNSELQIQFRGDNLLDQERVEAGADLGALGSGFVTYARPRSFMLQVTGTF